VKGILNAFKTTFESKVLGRGVQVGGSGITQQLVKLSLFSTDASDRTLKRKLQEIWISVQVDSIYSKERQLEWYINKVYEGYGRYGAQTISRFYYGRNLNKLSVDQQALVAGLGQSPSVYNVYQNPEAVKKRRNLVLAAMQSTGAINKQQYQQSVQQPVNHGVVPIEKHERPANVRKIDDVVSNALQEAEEAGYKPRTESLKIYTSLNTKAQNVLYGQINDNPNF
ncbi:transglycosylase domain-containing protein, partial [Periweissella ghanensis]